MTVYWTSDLLFLVVVVLPVGASVIPFFTISSSPIAKYQFRRGPGYTQAQDGLFQQQQQQSFLNKKTQLNN